MTISSSFVALSQVNSRNQACYNVVCIFLIRNFGACRIVFAWWSCVLFFVPSHRPPAFYRLLYNEHWKLVNLAMLEGLLLRTIWTESSGTLKINVLVIRAYFNQSGTVGQQNCVWKHVLHHESLQYWSLLVFQWHKLDGSNRTVASLAGFSLPNHL